MATMPTVAERFLYMFQNEAAYSESIRPYAAPYRDSFESLIADLIRQGQADGEIVTDTCAEQMAEYVVFLEYVSGAAGASIESAIIPEIALTVVFAGLWRAERALLHHITPVSIPQESRIAKVYSSMNLADAYSIELPVVASTNAEQLARFMFAHQPAWINGLLAVALRQQVKGAS
ncbi:hypothetical protein [Duganella caerulea]|uniref:hypothetical protein n=1 Tax=Duganella caerulea TaxID=2885762 RepID=UPI004038354C